MRCKLKDIESLIRIKKNKLRNKELSKIKEI